jgi:glycosyltransferase involved in cell wall biosynthesis
MKFSIGIPAFKAMFLKECINNILAQTYNDFEIIIVNDASPENIDEIILHFAQDKIRYFKNEKNFGAEHVVDNWNTCLGNSTGDYFILMGDDDIMEKNYLEEFVNLINKYPNLDVYHCRSKIIDDKSSIISITPSWPEYESVYENIWHRIKLLRIQYISDFVFRSEALKNAG